MYKIMYSNQAQVDLEDAIAHIAKESVTNALKYLQSYEEKMTLLQSNPYIGVECKSKFIKRECRILIHKSHIIIYKINESVNDISLIRIYHGSVDYANKLNMRKSND